MVRTDDGNASTLPHSHGGDRVGWRPARRMRFAVLGALLPFIVATVAGLIVLWPSHHQHPVPLQYQTYGEGKTVYENGTVGSVTSRSCGGGVSVSGSPATSTVCSTIGVAISSGPDEGQAITISTGGAGDVMLKVGDEIRVARGPVINPQTGERAYSFDDYRRGTPLIVVAVIFAVVLVLVARLRGFAALAGLGAGFVVLVYFLLPALLDGHSPIATALIASSAILLVAMYVAHGFSYRTTTALLGTLCALLVTAGAAAVAISATRLTGRSDELNTLVVAAGIPISIPGLLLCGTIIGALGVINDVTVTQASSVWELSAADPHASWRTLFVRGMRIGRDHIASVVYTLVFAYTGAALPLLLLFSVSGRGLGNIFTGDNLATEIVRNAVGGMGLVLAVPLTTLIAAVVSARPHEDPPHAADKPSPKPTSNLDRKLSTSTLQPDDQHSTWR